MPAPDVPEIQCEELREKLELERRAAWHLNWWDGCGKQQGDIAFLALIFHGMEAAGEPHEAFGDGSLSGPRSWEERVSHRGSQSSKGLA